MFRYMIIFHNIRQSFYGVIIVVCSLHVARLARTLRSVTLLDLSALKVFLKAHAACLSATEEINKNKSKVSSDMYCRNVIC